ADQGGGGAGADRSCEPAAERPARAAAPDAEGGYSGPAGGNAAPPGRALPALRQGLQRGAATRGAGARYTVIGLLRLAAGVERPAGLAGVRRGDGGAACAPQRRDQMARRSRLRLGGAHRRAGWSRGRRGRALAGVVRSCGAGLDRRRRPPAAAARRPRCELSWGSPRKRRAPRGDENLCYLSCRIDLLPIIPVAQGVILACINLDRKSSKSEKRGRLPGYAARQLV